MDRDPRKWGVEEVVTYLCKTPDLWGDYSSTNLPDLAALEQSLRYNQVNGAKLLDQVNIDVLKTDLQVKSSGARAAVLYVVEKLRYRSQIHTAAKCTEDANNISLSDVSTSHPTKRKGQVVPNLRKGETVVSSGGIKKRRLQLVPQPDGHLPAVFQSEAFPSSVIPTNLSQEQITSGNAANTYFGRDKLPINSLSYGGARNGAEVAAEEGYDNDNDDFMFSTPNKTVPVGKKRLIGRRMKKYLQNNGTDIDHDNDLGMLRSFHDPPMDDEVLPLYGESDYEGESSELEEIEREIEEDAAAERREAKQLTKEQVGIIVEEYIEKKINHWDLNKAPRKEQNALQIWKKAQGRAGGRVVSDTKAQLQHLELRLEKIKEEICAMQWGKAKAVQKQCQILDTTVEDQKDLQWKIDLWRRPTAPQVVAKSRPTQRKKRAAVSGSDDGENVNSESDRSVPASDDSDDSDEDVEIEPTIKPSVEVASASSLPVVAAHSNSSRPSSNGDVAADRFSTPLVLREPSATTSASPEVTIPEEEDSEEEGYVPEEETPTRAKQWSSDFCRGHRRRSLVKCMRTMPSDMNASILERFRINPKERMRSDISHAIGALIRGETSIPESLGVALQPAVFLIARLYACWVAKDPNYWMDDIPKEVLSKALKVKDYLAFDKSLRMVLRLKDSQQSAVTDEVGEQSGRKQRKKVVKRDLEAQNVRNDAKARKAEFDLKVSSLLESTTAEENLKGFMVNICGNNQKPIILNSRFRQQIKPHQVHGVRVMWRELLHGEGILLSHTMGLGKTMQVIAVLVTVAEASNSPDLNVSKQIPPSLKDLKALILCPPMLAFNWENEFKTWSPTEPQPIGSVWIVSRQLKPAQRKEIVARWSREGGVLVMGFALFQGFLRRGNYSTDTEFGEMEKALLKDPEVVVCDEAHRLCGKASKIARLATRFRTKRRIALTGSPLMNDLSDYFRMIDWVRPGYLGAENEFDAYFKEPIQEGNWANSTPEEQKNSLQTLEVLKQEIAPKADRADLRVLENDLPPKTEFVIKVPLTPWQRKAYDDFVDAVLKYADTDISDITLFDWLGLLSLLCDHPSAFYKRVSERNAIKTTTQNAVQKMFPRQKAILQAERIENKECVSLSNKAVIVDKIIRESKRVGDQVLVFSQHLPMLDYLEEMIQSMEVAHPDEGQEPMHVKTHRLDGSTSMDERKSALKRFDKGKFDVFLISTKAGGVGLNLPAANRVILVDFFFNPTHVEQAVGRAYRIGQAKEVFVYHLLTGGTYEERLYGMNTFKRQLASRVVDDKRPTRSAEKAKTMLFKPQEVEQQDLDLHRGKDEIIDSILDSGCRHAVRGLVTTATIHAESGETLTAEEVKEGQARFEARQRRLR